MAINLPRLDRTVPIAEDNGLPSLPFHLTYDRAAEAIEQAVAGLDTTVTDIVDILVRLGLVETTADGALTLAESAIKPGGEIKDNKVVTTSIVADAVTKGAYVQTTGSTVLPDGVETEVLGLSFSKQINESVIELDCTLRISSSNDIIGVFKLYRDTTLLDEIEYNCQTNGGIYKALIPYSFATVS